MNKAYRGLAIFGISLSKFFFLPVFSQKIIRSEQKYASARKKFFKSVRKRRRSISKFDLLRKNAPAFFETALAVFLHEFRSVRRAQGVVGLAVSELPESAKKLSKMFF